MENLSNLQAGDWVVLTGRGRACWAVTVDRVTPTEAIIGPSTYSLATGQLVGGNQWSSMISRDPQLFAKVRRQQAEDNLNGFPFSRAGVEEARQAADFAEGVLRESGEWD